MRIKDTEMVCLGDVLLIIWQKSVLFCEFFSFRGRFSHFIWENGVI